MNQIEVHGAIINYLDSGIIHVHYTSEFLNLEGAKKVINTIRKHSPWDICPILVSADPFSEHDNDAEKFLAGEDVMQYCSGIAIIVSNLAQVIGTNFFIKLNNPSKPTKFFRYQEEALKWLANFETVPRQLS